jgi:TolB-like protein
LWGDDVFVDTEHGINTAIRKIRYALKDDPEQPRYVQTVTGKGYRFVATSLNGESSTRAVPEKRQPPVAVVAPAPEKRRRTWTIATGAAVLLLIATVVIVTNAAGILDRILGRNRVTPIHSIAVLPLENLSGDPNQDYFADGMTDELITMLAKNASLRVVSRTSAMQYKGINRPVRDIARELGVDGILEGSIARTGNRVHMNLQLIHGPSDSHIWAESYDRDLNDTFSLPSEASQAIAKAVKLPTLAAPPQPYINPLAHDAYLRGRYLWFTSFGNPNIRKYFQQAIQLQPDYAAAWSGLADSYTADAVDGLGPPGPSIEQGGEAARKAVELDDSVPEAHQSLAAYYFFGKRDWQNTEKESLRALQLNPNFAEAYHLYSYLLVVTQRPNEALRAEERSMELDPFARPWALGLTYIQTRQIDAAINELQLRMKGQPDGLVHLYLSQAYWLKGMWADSQRQLEEGLRLIGRTDAAAAVHNAFVTGGEKAVEEWGIRDVKARARKGYVSPMDIATRYAFLGDKENTIQYLQVALREGTTWMIFLQNEPVFDFLHSDPRYRSIVRELGLPPAGSD